MSNEDHLVRHLKKVLCMCEPSEIHHYGGIEAYEKLEMLHKEGWEMIRIVEAGNDIEHCEGCGKFVSPDNRLLWEDGVVTHRDDCCQRETKESFERGR